MKHNLTEKIKNALIKVLNLDSNKNIISTTRLKEDLGLDSMSSLTFLMALEESIIGFIVDPETLESNHLETLDTITEYVLLQLKEAKDVYY
ncbi:MAG: hypothetical protein A3F10_00330 [Coxiella sp. RIFCSPHIGHO2_12_FULL_42_15]|nr:MAG: hypothetical protein A3F10_00330 [Coxiella sp. RIFCSPHIGHO2_12_FULL_42_15]